MIFPVRNSDNRLPDQTTNSITFAVYMLSKYPEVCKRLRQEILEHVGESRRPTFDDMKDMKYLRAVINETIRLYPAVYVTPLNSSCRIENLIVNYVVRTMFVPRTRRSSYPENMAKILYTFQLIAGQLLTDIVCRCT